MTDAFLVSTFQGNQFLSKTVFIAGGVSAFQPRTINLEGMDAFVGKQVFLSRQQS